MSFPPTQQELVLVFYKYRDLFFLFPLLTSVFPIRSKALAVIVLLSASLSQAVPPLWDEQGARNGDLRVQSSIALLRSASSSTWTACSAEANCSAANTSCTYLPKFFPIATYLSLVSSPSVPSRVHPRFSLVCFLSQPFSKKN